MRIGLLTEGGYPYVGGEGGVWCDRLVRGLDRHEFDVYAFSTGQVQEDTGWVDLPPQVQRVRTAPLWTAEEDGVVHGRRARRRFAEHYGELAAALCTAAEPGTAQKPSAAEADRFANALHGLAELARDEGGLVAALRSEHAVRALERACRAPGARRTAREARVPDLLTVAGHLERALRPSPSTGTRRTVSAPSTSAMPRPAASPRSRACSPATSSASRSWSPSTACVCAPTTSRAPTPHPPYGPCSPPSTAC